MFWNCFPKPKKHTKCVGMAMNLESNEYTQIVPKLVLSGPSAIAFDKSSRTTYIAASREIVKITPDGNQTEIVLKLHSYRCVSYIALTKDGTTLYFAENIGHRINKIDLLTNAVQFIAGSGIGRRDGPCSVAAFHQLKCIALDQTEQNLFVCDSGNSCIRKIDLKHNIVSTITGKTKGKQDGHFDQATFYHPHGLCFDSNWNLYVSDYLGNAIRYLNFQTNQVTTVIGSTAYYKDGPLEDALTSEPNGMFYDPVMDCLWFGDGSSHVRRLDIQSKTVTTVVGVSAPGSTWLHESSFTNSLHHMCMDNNRNVLITDFSTGLVWKMLYNKKREWKFVRLLWVGHLKNTPDCCLLAKLPREMVSEISRQLINMLYS